MVVSSLEYQFPSDVLTQLFDLFVLQRECLTKFPICPFQMKVLQYCSQRRIVLAMIVSYQFLLFWFDVHLSGITMSSQ